MSKGSVENKQGRQSATRSSPRQQRNAQLQGEQARKKRNRLMLQLGLITGGIVLFSIILYFVINAGSSTNSASAKTIDGLSCEANEGAVTHTHAALKMYVNGQQSQIPANIGVNTASSCLYAVHTHATNNIIHVEAPDRKTYTLGQFFDIWGQPLSRTQVADNTSDASNNLTFEVFDANGKLTPYTGDPKSLPLTDHETIVILYNSPAVQPTPFTGWNKV